MTWPSSEFLPWPFSYDRNSICNQLQRRVDHLLIQEREEKNHMHTQESSLPAFKPLGKGWEQDTQQLSYPYIIPEGNLFSKSWSTNAVATKNTKAVPEQWKCKIS